MNILFLQPNILNVFAFFNPGDVIFSYKERDFLIIFIV